MSRMQFSASNSLSPISALSRSLAIPLAISLAFSLALSGCGKADAPLQKPQTELPVEAVEIIAPLSVPQSITALGEVVPDHRVEAASRLSAYIEAIPKKEGDLVKAGDVVARLDSRDVEAGVRTAAAKVSAAAAAARDAALDHEKFSALYKEGLVSENDWRKITLKNEAAQSDKRQAEAMLAAAKAQLAYTTVRSPIDGRVARVLKREGDLALPGLPIVVVDSETNPKVEFSIPQNQRQNLQTGTEALVRLEGDDSPFTGTIERTTESADRISRTTLARIAFSEDDRTRAEARLRPGMYVRVEVKLDGGAEPASPWIPESVLATRGGLEGAFVLEDGKAKFRWLRIGKRQNGQAEVLAGLNAGSESDSLINHPYGTLRDGSPVKVSETQDPLKDAASKPEGAKE
ncbi:efflux RND transporter periplasmic adaptor subunit [uncultured Sutterella sp.]|uniref:efflux RND transporter periplasmic adaptor subunit n=1 Tax=uncultured Sutterella sp. TaxID=286133 RepID=UPI002610E79C|nr:efflux RND transporter periplasmic adaptor subunit [uncultured Sutterella sp.]